jgi:hypothetical protein
MGAVVQDYERSDIETRRGYGQKQDDPIGKTIQAQIKHKGNKDQIRKY